MVVDFFLNADRRWREGGRWRGGLSNGCGKRDRMEDKRANGRKVTLSSSPLRTNEPRHCVLLSPSYELPPISRREIHCREVLRGWFWYCQSTDGFAQTRSKGYNHRACVRAPSPLVALHCMTQSVMAILLVSVLPFLWDTWLKIRFAFCSSSLNQLPCWAGVRASVTSLLYREGKGRNETWECCFLRVFLKLRKHLLPAKFQSQSVIH